MQGFGRAWVRIERYTATYWLHPLRRVVVVIGLIQR